MRESIRAVFGAFRALGFVRILLAPERPSAMFPLSAGIRWTLGFEGLQGARLEGRVWRCSVALSDRARGGAGVVPAARTRSEERRVGKECRYRWGRYDDDRRDEE